MVNVDLYSTIIMKVSNALNVHMASWRAESEMQAVVRGEDGTLIEHIEH